MATTGAGLPGAQGLYDPRNEHDACGVGFIAQMKGVKSHQIVQGRSGHAGKPDASRRGRRRPADGRRRGVLVQIPDRFFREEMAAQGVELPPAGQYGVGHWFMPQDQALRDHIDEIIVEVCRFRGIAAHRLPRRAGRQFVAVEGASDRRVRALSTSRCSLAVLQKSMTTRNTKRGSICCAR
jgi:glutamate synthase domain-containing protein 1